MSPIFGDNRVLQRRNPTIWGCAKPGKEIRVTITDNSVKTATKDDGRWSVVIVARRGVPKAGMATWIHTCQHIDGWIDVPILVRARVPAPTA